MVIRIRTTIHYVVLERIEFYKKISTLLSQKKTKMMVIALTDVTMNNNSSHPHKHTLPVYNNMNHEFIHIP